MTIQENIVIEKSAKVRIEYLLTTEEKGSIFRIEVIGGGCSGFQYKFGFDDKFDIAEDIILEKCVAIDKTSAEFLMNCRLQYIQTLGSAYFAIENPNAKAKCGCGSSFAL